MVPALVVRALSQSPGIKPAAILAHAENALERMIKPASIRSELNAGKKEGKYESKDGKWFLSGGAGGVSGKTPPPASESEQQGGISHAAAIVIDAPD